jgi:hypothetical protein
MNSRCEPSIRVFRTPLVDLFAFKPCGMGMVDHYTLADLKLIGRTTDQINRVLLMGIEVSLLPNSVGG